MHFAISHFTISDIQIYGNPYVVKGDTIYLTCNATGTSNPPDTVDWFKGGHKVVTDSDQKIFVKKDVSLKSKTIGSTLRIRHARMQDTGTYICRTSDLQITKLQVNVLNGTYILIIYSCAHTYCNAQCTVSFNEAWGSLPNNFIGID